MSPQSFLQIIFFRQRLGLQIDDGRLHRLGCLLFSGRITANDSDRSRLRHRRAVRLSLVRIFLFLFFAGQEVGLRSVSDVHALVFSLLEPPDQRISGLRSFRSFHSRSRCSGFSMVSGKRKTSFFSQICKENTRKKKIPVSTCSNTGFSDINC